MSKVYNESCFKRNQHVSRVFFVDLYYKLSPTVQILPRCVYDLVMTIVQSAYAQWILYTCYLSINFVNRNDMLPVWYK